MRWSLGHEAAGGRGAQVSVWGAILQRGVCVLARCSCALFKLASSERITTGCVGRGKNGERKYASFTAPEG